MSVLKRYDTIYDTICGCCLTYYDQSFSYCCYSQQAWINAQACIGCSLGAPGVQGPRIGSVASCKSFLCDYYSAKKLCSNTDLILVLSRLACYRRRFIFFQCKDRMCFCSEGHLFELFSVAVNILHAVYAPQAPRVLAACCVSRFWRSALSAWSWKTKTVEKCPTSYTFFSIVQSNEWRAGPSVVVIKVYRWSPETAMMEELTFGVCRGLPGAVFF